MFKPIFISYSTDDTAITEQIRDGLEAAGIACWMAPRDIAPGMEYGVQILDAIEACSVLVLMLSVTSNESRFVRNEVERAVSKDKVIIPVRIDDLQPSRGLEFFISNAQWIDALDGVDQAAQALAAAIRAHVGMAAVEPGGRAIPMDEAREIPHNVPASTSPFVGRETELAALDEMLADPTRRLITIVGPGGMGKTRLALEVGRRQLSAGARFTTGVYFIPLAPLRSAEHIAPAIVDDLGIQPDSGQQARGPEQQLCNFLASKAMLLILDNFEHLLDGTELVTRLLQAAPQLHVLATSRERLHLRDEQIFPLQGLTLAQHEPAEEGTQSTAATLFVQSARRVRPDLFELTANDAIAVTRICRLVGGVPLALELAAAWADILPLAEIAQEIQQSLDFLETTNRDVPARQRSMRAIFDSSWQRLNREEQDILAQLSVFRGGFDRHAAHEVAGASIRVLASLAAKSLVQVERALGRYDIHELVRQFAEQQLEYANAGAATQAAHATHYVRLVHECEATLAGPDQLEAIHQLEADFENIRTAWYWATETKNAVLIDQALDGLFRWFFWLRRSRQQESLALLRLAQQAWMPVTAQAPDQLVPPIHGRIQARILERQGPWIDNPNVARQRIEPALALARRHEGQTEETFCMWALGLAILSQYTIHGREKDLQLAIQYFIECIDAYRTRQDHFWLAQSLENLGHTYRRLGQYDQAVSLLQESHDLRRQQGDRFGIARSLRELAWARLFQGLERETLDTARSAYALQRDLGDHYGIADSRFFLALSLLCCGDWQSAQELLQQVQQFAEEMNNDLYRRWASNGFVMATCMEQNAHQLGSPFCSFPNRFSRYTSKLASIIFGLVGNQLIYARLVQELYLIASTEEEIAVGLPFAAVVAARGGEWHRAVRLLALAHSYTVVAEGWVGLLPPLVALQQEVRRQMPSSEFKDAWAQGQRLDIWATAAEIRETAADMDDSPQ